MSRARQSWAMFLVCGALAGSATGQDRGLAQAPLAPALAEAIRQADVEAIKLVLNEDPAQVHACDERHWTPLMHAAFYADERCLRLLLAAGADVRVTNEVGATALHYAAVDLPKTRALVEAGADVNSASRLGNTPLMLAARNCRSAASVRLLLANGADVHARNIYGVTALMVAASSDDVESVELLLERGADPSLSPYFKPVDADGNPVDPIFSGGQTALAWAARTGNVDIAQRLLDADAKIDGQSMFGTPLIAAAQKNQKEIAQLLLERGAKVDTFAPGGRWTPLMWAAANEHGDPGLARLLLAHGANVNVRRGSGWGPFMSVSQTPLTIALRRGNTELVEMLRAAGAKQREDAWAGKTVEPPQRDISEAQLGTGLLLAAAAAAVPLLERTAVESVEEFSSHGQNCVSCHNQLLPLMALSAARKKGVPCDEQAAEQLAAALLRDATGGFAYNAEATFHPSPSSFSGYLLWGLASEDVAADFAIDATLHAVALNQSADGSWLQFFPRPPITDGEISATALAVRALTLYPLAGRQQEMSDRVAAARDWLQASQPRVTEDYVYKLLGLYWAGVDRDALTPLVTELAALQRADGGWAQLPKLKSDAYATGQAVFALSEVGGIESRGQVLRRGLVYLLRNQLQDGSWFVRRRAYPFQPTMDPAFPHGRDAWISAAATSWAVMALCAGLDRELVEEVLQANGEPVWATAQPASASLPPAAEERLDFLTDILPILESSCLDCHNSATRAGSYSLESRGALIKGGFSGRPVVVPGNSKDSLLIKHVAGWIEDVEMPPLARRNEYEPLTAEQIGMLRGWIDQGLPGLDD